MSELKRFFGQLLKPFLLLMVVSFPLLFFNVVIDPFKVFLKGFPISYIEPNKQNLKMNYILKNKTKFDSFIFGSSRTNFIDPSDIHSGKYYNMTYPGGIPNQHFKNIAYLYKKGVKIQNLIIAVDYLSFFNDKRSDADNLVMKDFPVTLEEKFNFYKTYLFLFPEKKLIKEAISKTPIDYSALYSKGIMINHKVNDDIEADIDKFVNQPKFKIPYSKYENDRPIDLALSQIDSIVQFSKRHHINLKIFINPTHVTTYVNINLDEYYEALRKLAKITDYYDFSGLNNVALDNYNYFEPSHFRLSVGKMIIAKIENISDKTIPDDFGRMVTKDNIENHIQFHEKLFYDYIRCCEWPLKTDNPIKISNFKMSSVQTLYSIDRINGIPFTDLKKPMQITSSVLKLEGWAIDDIAHSKAKNVYVEIDGKYFKSEYGIERNDVALKYGNAAYSKSGWKISIPTSAFKKGNHNLSLVIISPNEKYFFTSKPIEIDILYSSNNHLRQSLKNLGETSLLNIEQINGQKPKNSPIYIDKMKLNIRGWAIDKDTSNISGGVIVTLNNHSYVSQYITERPDISRQFGKKNLNNSGWGITIPCDRIPKGDYELQFKVLNKTMSGYYTIDKSLIITNQENKKPGHKINKIFSIDKSGYNIDNINGMVANNQSSPIMIKSDSLCIQGWAFNSKENILAEEVQIKIDDQFYRTKYGLKRADVAKHFKNKKITNSGWSLSIPTSSIGKGTHSISIVIVFSGKSKLNDDNQKIEIEVL
jgi:hypothetical protein